jgi:uncharacterized protein DUF4412
VTLTPIRCAAAVTLCLFARPLLAADGILLVEKTTSGAKVETRRVQIEANRMLAESTGPDGSQLVVIFDGPAQVLRIINPEKKSYTEMTKADLDAMGAQMSGMMAQMQEQMKNMPPAARAQMEAMMKKVGSTAPTGTEYRKAGADKVGKWACDKYEGYQGGQKTSELCTVDPKTLGFTTADFQVTQQLADFFQKMMPQGSDQIFSLGKAGPQGFSGVPVRRSYSVLGKPAISELTEASRQSFPDTSYAVPAGFEKQALGIPGR